MIITVQSILLRYPRIGALVFGAFFPLAFAPFNIWPVAVICPALLFILWKDVSPRSAAAIGFWFGFGAFGTGTYWLYNSIYTIGHAPIWLTLFLMLGMAALMASYFAVFGYAQGRWLPSSGALRYLVGLPALWVLCEWWRGWFVSGFPWMSLGYAFVDTPLAGLAPILGVYGVTAACALTSGALAFITLGTLRQRLAGIVVAVLPWLIAMPYWHHEWTQPIHAPVSVAIVQGAVPETAKWSEEWRDKTLERYRELAEPYFGKRLMVWPEAALPAISTELVSYLNSLWGEAHAKDTDILMGLLQYEPRTDKVYNAVLALGDHVEWYHKRHLVPFAEYFPVPSFVRNWLRMMSLPYSNITAGTADQKPLDAAGEKIGTSICYEDGFGAEQLHALPQATLLVNVTNDAWFGDSIAAPQHLEISRMRALEAGRDMIRAANDGISAIINSEGKVLATLPRFKPMVLTGTVQPRSGATPYVHVGNWPVLIGCELLSILAWLLSRIQLKGKSKQTS